MPTFIKTGFWDKKKSGFNQELNLDNLITSIAGNGSVGPQGPIGPQGIAGTNGVPGPVGPAGLNWQGEWTSGDSYVQDDAVGYGGASYFCILATSGTLDPSVDTTNWALLASQGAQGIQGVQGPTGAQGASGVQVTKVLKTTITSAQVLQLFTTPITILNSSNPLTVAYPISIYIKRNVGTAYGLSTNQIQIVNDYGTALSVNINSNPLGQPEGFTQAAISANQNVSGSGVYKNLLYKLKASSSNPTLGTGDLDVYVTYIEITL
jgi:hypothetical protein